jgi:DNA primase
MKHEQLNYHDALRYLAKKYNIEVQERELTNEEKQSQSDRESMFIVNQWAQKHFTSRLLEHEEGRTIGLRYFAERGFRDETIRKFQLGYSLEKRDDLYQTAIGSGYKKDFLEKTGLVTFYENGAASDRFRGRVIFPVHTLSGKVVAFGGRILKKNEKTAKYVNSPESDIYHKSNELYGIYFAKQAIAKADNCFLVEGYTDVISMHQSGVGNVVASSGTALTKGQIHTIHRLTNNITVIYDGDAPGIKAAIRGIDLLLEEGMNVKVVLLPDGEDPDSFARAHSAFEFNVYIQQHETDFIRFKTKLLLDEAGNDPIKRAKLISDIIHSIAVIPDDIIRSEYIKECRDMLDVKEQVLLNELNKIRSNRRKTPPVSKTNISVPQDMPEPPEMPAPPEAYVPYDNELPPEAFVPYDELPPPDAFVPYPRQKQVVSPYKAYEEALLRYIIEFGEWVLFDYEEDGERIVIKVAQYIHSELQRDEIVFSVPQYKSILDESVAHCSDANFIASRYFLSHPDPGISRIAVDLADENYLFHFDDRSMVTAPITDKGKEEQKSQFLKRMEEFEQAICRDLFALKEAYILQKINDTGKQIKDLQAQGNIDQAIELMKEQQHLNEIKMILSKELGERIILKM